MVCFLLFSFLRRQQSNAKVLAYQDKKENLLLLKAHLGQVIQHFDVNDTVMLRAALEELVGNMEKIQNNLCTHLAYVPEIKKVKASGWDMLGLGKSILKSAARAVATSAKVDDSKGYIGLLHDICVQCQTFDQWIYHFDDNLFVDVNSASILECLKRITEFLQVVFLAIVIREMKALLSRYSKHCTRSLISSV